MTLERNEGNQLIRQVEILRDIMLTVHYYEESHWLAAAMSFPKLCQSPLAQDALRRAAKIAWEMHFPAVSRWLQREFLVNAVRQSEETFANEGRRPLRQLPVSDLAC